MTTKQLDLFQLINESSNHLPELNEDYYRNYLLYKDFQFEESKVDELAPLLAGIQHTLIQAEEKHYMLLDKRLLDAQDALISACESIYSERIKFNPILQALVQNTIVLYYKGRFQISFSREISLLPLELRLFIYTSLLSTEASSIRQMYLLDRVALTLHKADESFLGDCATFVSAWIKYKLSKETTGRKVSFPTILKMESQSILGATNARKKILKQAEMTPEEAASEFWYGFKGYSDIKNIHNVEAAKICLELFCSYYESSPFGFIQEMKPIFLENYKTRNAKKLNQLVEKEGIDTIKLEKMYVSANYTTQAVQELDSDKIDLIDQAQKQMVQKLIENRKENQYLFINPAKKPLNPDHLIFPEEISQKEASSYLNNLMQILITNRITLLEFNEYLFSLTTSIMSSTDWDIKIQNVIIGVLGDLYGKVWLRDKQNEKDAHSLLKAAVDILGGNFTTKGTGWPIALMIVEGKMKNQPCTIFYSKSASFPEFAGQFFIGVNPLLVDQWQIEDAVKGIRNLRIYWQRIEKAQNPSRSVNRKRSNYWQRLKAAREQELR